MAVGPFLAAVDGTLVAASYASIGSQFGQLQNSSWIVTGYMLTLCSFQYVYLYICFILPDEFKTFRPLYGKLSDIFGRKSCLLFAYVVFGFGCLFCGLARNMNELIIARAFSGIGGGGVTMSVSFITTVFRDVAHSMHEQQRRIYYHV